MNFEEAFRHYKEGTATPEEKDLVHDELAKAKALSPLLDDEGIVITPPPIAKPEKDEIKAAKKSYMKKRVLIAFGAAMVMLVLVGAALGGVFGAAATYAGENIVYGEQEAYDIAHRALVDFMNKEHAKGNYWIFPEWCTEDDFRLKPDRDRKEFNFRSDIKSSYYVYEFEFGITGTSVEIEYEVDSTNGIYKYKLK